MGKYSNRDINESQAKTVTKAKISYGDCDLEYSDKEYKITFEVLIKLIKSVIGENDISLLNCGKNTSHVLIVVEDGDQKGGSFYDFSNRTAFNMTQNWAGMIEDIIEMHKEMNEDMFSETLYNREKDPDYMEEDEWRRHID